jgi:hypothetical protein
MHAGRLAEPPSERKYVPRVVDKDACQQPQEEGNENKNIHAGMIAYSANPENESRKSVSLL